MLSRPLQFESSYTVLQHAPVESIETEIVPQAVKTISALKEAWRLGNHREVVELIGQEVRADDDAEEEEFQRVVEATLLADGSGEITRHPYIHSQLSRLMARWANKLMTGGGIELPAFALADDGFLVLQNDKVHAGADWMPRSAAITTVPSATGLCVRYVVADHIGNIGTDKCGNRSRNNDQGQDYGRYKIGAHRRPRLGAICLQTGSAHRL